MAPTKGLIRERVKGLVDALLEGEADPAAADPVRWRRPGARSRRVSPTKPTPCPMFGGSRVIWIEAQARDIGPALEPLFSAPPRDCAIVVEAGSLKKGTALRSAFEKIEQRRFDRMLSRRQAQSRRR